METEKNTTEKPTTVRGNKPSSEPEKMNISSTRMNKGRRSRAILILELYSQGLGQAEIAEELGIGQATVSRDSIAFNNLPGIRQRHIHTRCIVIMKELFPV